MFSQNYACISNLQQSFDKQVNENYNDVSIEI
jgi:uncharacterized protein YecT (DUF1311 family)